LLNNSSQRARILIGAQHIPAVRDNGFPPDNKPYWVISEPYLSDDLDPLPKLGVEQTLAGHWHNARVLFAKGISWHVAPSTYELASLGRRTGFGSASGFAGRKCEHRIHTHSQCSPLDRGGKTPNFYTLG